jgi:hypothetical protein
MEDAPVLEHISPRKVVIVIERHWNRRRRSSRVIHKQRNNQHVDEREARA